MEQILKLKEESEAFQTEFEVLAPSTLPADIEAQYQAYQTQIAALTPEIERLTNHADGIDYAAAVSCGIVTGMLDALLPGAKWDFREAKAWSNKSVNMMIQEFAEGRQLAGFAQGVGGAQMLEGQRQRGGRGKWKRRALHGGYP